MLIKEIEEMVLGRFIKIVLIGFAGINCFSGRAMSSVFFDDSGSSINAGNGIYEVAFSKENGALYYIRDKKAGLDTILASPESLLWKLSPEGMSNEAEKFSYDFSRRENKLSLNYSSADLDTAVIFTFGKENYFDAVIIIENRGANPVESVWFPCDIVFPFSNLKRFVYPYNIGIALQPLYFEEIEKNERYEVKELAPGVETEPGTAEFSHPGPLFSDFVSIDSKDGRVSIYLIQDKEIMETAYLRIGCSGKKKGLGRYDHKFFTYIPQNNKWESSRVRFEVGTEVDGALRNYGRLNKLDSAPPLKEKLGDIYEKVANSVMFASTESSIVYEGWKSFDRVCSELPSPTILYISPYWSTWGDIPDYLPPDERLGSEEDFKNFISSLHSRGQLLMPLIASLAWGLDSPTGKKFKPEDISALRNKDGEIFWQGQEQRTVFVSPYHPKVREINRKIIQKFEDYGVDLIHDDALGAMPAFYDFNPVSPTPTAYNQGLINLGALDSEIMPLVTETGFDMIVPVTAGFSGLTWGMLKGGDPESWSVRKAFGDYFERDYWRLYPIAQFLSHHSVAFYHHNLGSPVTNKYDLSLSLVLGYNMNKISSYHDPWMKIDESIQKSVCSKYFGRKLNSFEYLSPKVVKAVYEDLEIIANLSTHENYTLDSLTTVAKEGFLVRSGDRKLCAGIFRKFNGTLYDYDLLLIKERKDDAIKLTVFTFNSLSPLTVKLDELETPVEITPEIYPQEEIIEIPKDYVNKPPSQWEDKPEYIGVIDLEGCGEHQLISTAEFEDIFKGSQLKIRPIKTIDELYRICSNEIGKYLMVINPYGEYIPVSSPGGWRETVGAISNYVKNGGVWWEIKSWPFAREIYPGGKKETIDGWGGEVFGFQRLNHLMNKELDTIRVLYTHYPPAKEVNVTQEGKRWLGKDFLSELSGKKVEVADIKVINKKVALLSTETGSYISGYQLNGWGWFFRVEGEMDKDIVLKVIPKTAQYIYLNPPETLPFEGAGYNEVLIKAEK